MITLPQPEVTFPNVMQLGGRLMAPLSLAKSNERSYALAVDRAIEVLEFYHGDRREVGSLPSSFREVGPFARRLFMALKAPLTESVKALSNCPTPSRLRAEGVKDDVLFDCVNSGIIFPSAADRLITSASVYLYVVDTPYMGHVPWGTKARLKIAERIWVGKGLSGSELDQMRSLFVGYELVWPGRQGSTPRSSADEVYFFHALRNAVEADILRKVIDDREDKGPILGDIGPEKLSVLRDNRMISTYTYETIIGAIKQKHVDGPRLTVRLRIPYDLPDMTVKECAELQLIYRMHLAMKVWVGNVRFSEDEQSNVNTLLAEYGVKKPPRTDRVHFLDALRGSVETDLLREIINDEGVIQFIQPSLLQSMLEMGMLTQLTYNTVYRAIKRRRNAIHRRPTVKINDPSQTE